MITPHELARRRFQSSLSGQSAPHRLALSPAAFRTGTNAKATRQNFDSVIFHLGQLRIDEAPTSLSKQVTNLDLKIGRSV